MTNTTPVNRQIKDGVFKLLFEKPENAAELYYALTGIACLPSEIQIITLTTTVSGKLKNDLAFIVKGRVMVLGEHMSSPYENMPIRLLMYLGQLYEKWIKINGEERFLYNSRLYKIPTPEFVVFYNGTTAKPEKEILYLSSAFKEKKDKGLGFIELEVPVYNINKDMNEELFKNSSKLKQYSEFIAKIREFEKMYADYPQAVSKAVTHCVENNILTEFLEEHGGGIVSILATEYNEEIARRVYGEELLEDRNIELAKKMLSKGEPIKKIVEYTGLTIETINELT